MSTYTSMNDSNNNATLVIVDCDEGNMDVQCTEGSSPNSNTSSPESIPPDDETESTDVAEETSKCNYIDFHLKANLSRSRKNGQTSMMLACLSGYLSVVKKIAVNDNDNINQRDSEGNTALMLASQAGHSEIIRFLLWSYDKIEIDAENIFGLTALMKTALQGHSHCAKILIVAGADVEKRDHGRKYCAYDWALFCGFEGTSQIIKSVGSAGPLNVQRNVARIEEKQSRLDMAKSAYFSLKRRVSKFCCGEREEWVDSVGCLYYLVDRASPPGAVAWPFGWQKLDRIQLPCEEVQLDEHPKQTTPLTNSNEQAEAGKRFAKYTVKTVPAIMCTNSSPVAKTKSKLRNQPVDENHLYVPRKSKSRRK